VTLPGTLQLSPLAIWTEFDAHRVLLTKSDADLLTEKSLSAVKLVKRVVKQHALLLSSNTGLASAGGGERQVLQK
jgi:hypothetical protein